MSLSSGAVGRPREREAGTHAGRSRATSRERDKLLLEQTAARIRRLLVGKGVVSERERHGSVLFNLNGHLCCGLSEQGLVIRVGNANYAQAVARPYAGPLPSSRGRSATCYVLVYPAGYRYERDLDAWIQRGVDCLTHAGGRPLRRKVRIQAVEAVEV